MDQAVKEKIREANLKAYAGKPKHNKPSYYNVKGYKPLYNNADEERLSAIERVLSNKTRDALNDPKRKLSQKQIKKLRDYKKFYETKPSCRGGRIKPASIYASILTLRELGIYLNKPFEKATKEDLINYIQELNRKGTALSSMARLKVIIRSFYKWMHGIKEKHKFPEVVDDPLLVPENTKSNKRKKDLPTKDDVIKLVNACYNNQHKALIMLLSESGARAEEITSANIESIEFDDKGAKFFTEKSKSKERYIRLIHSVPFIETWLQEHPDKDNKKAPLFISFRRGEEFTGKRLFPKALTEMINRIKKRVPELKDKKLHAHLFRHLAVTSRWSEGMRTETNALRHGITTATLRNVYLHYDDKDASDEYDQLQGVKKSEEQIFKEEEERKKLIPKVCEYCKTKNEFKNKYCKECHKPLDVTTFIQEEEKQKKEMEELKNKVDDLLKASEFSKMAKELKQALEFLKIAKKKLK